MAKLGEPNLVQKKLIKLVQGAPTNLHDHDGVGERVVRGPKRSVVAMYQYFFPDDVIGSRQYMDLCEALAADDWRVSVLTSSSLRHSPQGASLKQWETWKGVSICRLWRPPFAGHRHRSRMLSSLWLLLAWCICLIEYRIKNDQPDILIIGTDPVLSVLVAWWSKRMCPKTKVVHWCFDLHPEAAIAERIVDEQGPSTKALKWLLRQAYQSCDLIADLGPCMRRRLMKYSPTCPLVTLTPWGLREPGAFSPFVSPNPTLKESTKPLSLLYSGTLGLAHSFERVLALSRQAQASSLQMQVSFGVRGSQAQALRECLLPSDHNIEILDFVAEKDLEIRLTQADIHLVTLKQEWTGIVVPSKFFAAMATGKPVIFSGSRDSSIARMILDFQVGWVLDTDLSLAQTLASLHELADHPQKLLDLQRHCWEIYQQHFCKSKMLKKWKTELARLAPPPALQDTVSSYQEATRRGA